MKSRLTVAKLAIPLVSLGLAGAAWAQETPNPTPAPDAKATDEKAPAEVQKTEAKSELIAVLMPTDGSQTTATVTFAATEDGKVLVKANVRGLKPNSEHGFHIHQFGDASSPDGESAGDHFNPGEHEHGLTDKAERHAGDLGNIKADDKGEATVEITVDNLKLEGQEGILGRSVIIHEKADTGGQPAGDAGKRIAQGVIGFRQSPEKIAAKG